jgi:hypothetical protein
LFFVFTPTKYIVFFVTFEILLIIGVGVVENANLFVELRKSILVLLLLIFHPVLQLQLVSSSRISKRAMLPAATQKQSTSRAQNNNQKYGQSYHFVTGLKTFLFCFFAVGSTIGTSGTSRFSYSIATSRLSPSELRKFW